MAYQSPIIKLAKYFPILEMVSLAAFAVGFALKAMDNQTGSQIITISLSALAVVYFMNAYIPKEVTQEPGTQGQLLGFTALLGRTIGPKILSIGSSVTVIGILFTVQHWNGFREMLLIGSTSLVAASVVGLVATMNDEQGRRTIGQLLLRAIPLMLIGIYLLMVYGISNPAF